MCPKSLHREIMIMVIVLGGDDRGNGDDGDGDGGDDDTTIVIPMS